MTSALPTDAAVPGLKPLLEKHCAECHDAEMKKGGLDLTSLGTDLADTRHFALWAKVHDRVQSGEMPPPKKSGLGAGDRDRIVSTLGSALLKADHALITREGRTVSRRLNRHEYENTLRDLLSLPYLEVKEFLPEDPLSHGYNKIGEALDTSHVQMGRYLAAADFALRQAAAPQADRPETTTRRYPTWDQGPFFGLINLEGPKERRTFPLVGLDLQLDLMTNRVRRPPAERPAAQKDHEAMAVVVSTYEPTEIRFSRFKAPVAGRYRLRFSGYSIWMNRTFTAVTAGRRSEPVTIYADTPPRLLRKLGSFDVHAEPTVGELDVWLLAGETIRPDAARLFRSRPPDHKNPLTTDEGMPGVAFQWMEVEGPILDEWPPRGHRLLFGDLPIRPATGTTPSARLETSAPIEILPDTPHRDARALLQNFIRNAYRAPQRADETDRFFKVFLDAERRGFNFADAMISAYTAVLSSPGFLYFHENPGRLTDIALAERLSYFLWNAPPDAQLRAVAAKGQLRRPDVLRRETDRLLNHPRSRDFVNAFLDYWLDLRLIPGTAPDAELYPDYQLDDLLVESITEEPQLFFAELIRRNGPVAQLVRSDFAMLNERLADHYGIPGVTGVGLRPVPLPANSVRGGLLTQAGVLKVTANGTTTSPVTRGAWVMARILGKPAPPPPEAVPAVEPDIRGATTIREQLAAHRTQESCNACHRHIDPAGFALESFDVMGAWRDRYRAVGSGTKVPGIGHNGLRYAFSLGPPVDPSGELPNGRGFNNVRDLKQLLAEDPDPLARNLAQQLVTYATGAPIRFGDRPEIAAILDRARPSTYGVRSLVQEVVQSRLFVHK